MKSRPLLENRRRPSPIAWLVFLCALGLAFCACGGQGPDPSAQNLLANQKPSAERGITHAERLTDGHMAVAGDHWETDLSTVLVGNGAYVEYDLGSEKPVDAVFLQGDNNDRFELWVAKSDRDFRKVWTAETVRGAGMRERHVDGLGAVARYVRIVSRPGDPAVSMSELMAFSTTPNPFPPAVPTRKGSERGDDTERWWLWFTALASAVLVGHKKTWPRPVLYTVFAATIAFGAFVLKQTIDDYPPTEGIINVLRLAAAVVSGAAVLRITLWPEDTEGRWITGNLAAMAALAIASFYNFFYPQFLNVAEDGRTYVHTWDMRVYFPTAKYFDELGFDGLYLASVKAYADDVPNALPHRIANVELRDLQTYRMTQVRDVVDQVHAVKDRFSPERWEEFRNDMAYFRETMGSGGYLGSLRDHGGNATPAWMLIAYLMFANATANEVTLLLAGALDPLLLLLFFVVAWRTFGVRTALVCLVVYGTTTFPWFGSNWAGSTLRNDWMVLLGLGVCALRSKRAFLGGVALAGAAMIRAFPAMAVFALPLPALFWYFDRKAADKRFPTLRELFDEHRDLFRALAGVTACVVVLFVASTAAFGFQRSWGTWAHKIGMHSVQPNVNHVGLRTVVAYDSDKTLDALHQSGGGNWSREQIRTYRKRMPIYIAFIALYTAAAIAASRGKRLEQAALFGLMLIPIYFYPSNYYLHYVFVLPLLTDYGEGKKRGWAWGLVCLTLLAMSAVEYHGFDTTAVDERYAEWSWSALIGFAVILGAFAREALRTRPVRTELPEPGEAAPEPRPETS